MNLEDIEDRETRRMLEEEASKRRKDIISLNENFQYEPELSDHDMETINQMSWKTMLRNGDTSVAVGDLEGALESYTWASNLSDPTYVRWFSLVMATHPRLGKNSPAHLIEEKPLLDILDHLRLMESIRVPLHSNKHRSLCFLKRSEVNLQLGKFQAALEDANSAIEWLPESLQAHRQKIKVLSKQCCEADVVSYKLRLNSLQSRNELFRCFGMALFGAGMAEKWFLEVWQNVKQGRFFEHLFREGILSVDLLASLVPFSLFDQAFYEPDADQEIYLLCNIQYTKEGKHYRFDGFHYVKIADEGGDDIDVHHGGSGIATPPTLVKARQEVIAFVADIAEMGFQINSCTLGQGLMPLAMKGLNHPLLLQPHETFGVAVSPAITHVFRTNFNSFMADLCDL